MTGYNTSTFRKQMSSRQNQRLFRHKKSSLAGSDLSNVSITTIVSGMQSFVKEEMFVDYGRDYMFCPTT